MYLMIFVCLIMLAAAVFDIAKRRIPILLIVVGFLGVCILKRPLSVDDGYELLFGAASGAILVPVCILSRGRVGMGDALLFIVTGMAIGAIANLVLMWAVFLIAGLFGTVRVLLKKGSMKDELPLVPFLFVGLLIQTLSEAAL